MQPTVVKNRSRMPRSRVTILEKQGSDRPQLLRDAGRAESVATDLCLDAGVDGYRLRKGVTSR
jgi:hypothetical protein